MKKYISLVFCMTAFILADQQTEFKLRDIAKPSVWSLRFQVPWICKGSIGSWFSLLFMFWHRDSHGDLRHNNLVVHGPDSVFLYAATRYRGLESFLPKIFAKFTESMAINEQKLEQFLKAKKEGTGILTYGDDIDVPLRLIASLKQKGWSDDRVDDFLSELTIKIHNKDDVNTYFKTFKEWSDNEKRTTSVSSEFKEMLDKKINPKKYIPKKYKWNFEVVQK